VLNNGDKNAATAHSPFGLALVLAACGGGDGVNVTIPPVRQLAQTAIPGVGAGTNLGFDLAR
jgi:hypothetical protein